MSSLLNIIKETLCSNASDRSFLVSVASPTPERIKEKVWKQNTAKNSYFEAESHNCSTSYWQEYSWHLTVKAQACKFTKTIPLHSDTQQSFSWKKGKLPHYINLRIWQSLSSPVQILWLQVYPQSLPSLNQFLSPFQSRRWSYNSCGQDVKGKAGSCSQGSSLARSLLSPGAGPCSYLSNRWAYGSVAGEGSPEAPRSSSALLTLRLMLIFLHAKTLATQMQLCMPVPEYILW